MTRLSPHRLTFAAAVLGAALAAAPATAEDWTPPDFATEALLPAEAAAAVPLALPEGVAEATLHALARNRIVAAARDLLGRPFRGDCSGFVLSLLRKAGIRTALPPARSRSEALYLGGAKVEEPRPGDLAFFHDTYDRNHDGRLNDRWTHVALVEQVEGGLVTLLHRGLHGIERLRMDLDHPSDITANDRVRIPRKGDPPGTRLLAGELFAGFGAVAN